MSGPPYRRSARPAPLQPLRPPSRRGPLLSAAVLSSVAAMGGAVAVVGGSVELALLAGGGAVAALAHWLRSTRDARGHDAMLRFLDNDRSRVGNPNQNFARELLELFTLGEGNYTERDVRETDAS